MKKTLYIALLALVAFSFAGCKEDNWLDWKTQNELWLVNNMLNDPDVKMTEDSLQYKIISQGNVYDVRPQSTSTVTVDYTGRFINGYVFDRGNGTELSMTGVVEGFAEGLTKIHNHGDIILYIPWQLAYGEDGSGTDGTNSFIPPYSTLIFEIHISAIN